MWGRTSTPPLSVEPGNERLRRRSSATRRPGAGSMSSTPGSSVRVRSTGWWSNRAGTTGGRWPATCGNGASPWRWSTRWRPSTSPRADCSARSQTRPTRAHWQPWVCATNPRRGSRCWAEVREAARFCMRLVRDQANVCQRLLRLVEIGFPELKEAFEDPTCDTALAILRQAPTARSAARRRLSTLAQAIKPGGRRAVGVGRANRVQELARDTIAPAELDEQMALEVRLLIEQYDLLGRQIEAAEKRVAELLDSELSRRLQTIPGVGPAIAASLIAEIGDIWRFDDFDQLAAYAGSHPQEQSSGRHGANPETSWRMAKTGNAYLRSALYRMAVVGLQHNPIIKQHYRRKREQGKAPMNAVGHCMGKALAIVWGVWRSGQDFDPSKGGPKT